MTGGQGDRRYATRYRSEWPPPVRRSEPPEPTESVALACGHTNEFNKPAPTVGQTVYCRTCDSYARTKETTDV